MDSESNSLGDTHDVSIQSRRRLSRELRSLKTFDYMSLPFSGH